jgi:CBS domain-containing protein
MRRRRMGCVIIVDEGGNPLGMFNEKLLIRTLTDRPDDAFAQPLDQYMTRNVVCVKTTDSIAKLINTMQKHKLRWVCVVDPVGRALAITGIKGVFEYLVDHLPRCVKVNPLQSRLAMKQREGA